MTILSPKSTLSQFGHGITEANCMKNRTLIAFAILSFGILAVSILPVFADSPDPQSGWRYYVVYNQNNGSLVGASGCSPPPAACEPILQQGQAVLYITDQPAVVKRFFIDARAGKGESWHVNLQTHQLEKTTPTGSVTSPLAFAGTWLINGGILPVIASVGVVLSAAFAFRRIHK